MRNLSIESIETHARRAGRTMNYMRMTNDFIFKMNDANVSYSAFKVMLYLLMKVNFQTSKCSFKKSHIAQDYGMNRTTVYRALEELTAKKFIKKLDDEYWLILDLENINRKIEQTTYKQRYKKRASESLKLI